MHTAITSFYQATDAGNSIQARQLLDQIKASGQAPSVFNIANAEKTLSMSTTLTRAQKEYAILKMMAQRENPAKVKTAVRQFKKAYPNYDPEGLVRYFDVRRNVLVRAFVWLLILFYTAVYVLLLK